MLTQVSTSIRNISSSTLLSSLRDNIFVRFRGFLLFCILTYILGISLKIRTDYFFDITVVKVIVLFPLDITFNF